MANPILCVDFDGVIHSYTSKWTNPRIISDPPVPGAIQWLFDSTLYFQVCIYSSRSKDPLGVAAMRQWLEDFATHELLPDDVPLFMNAITFSCEKPAAFLTIDDRAICFHGDFKDLSPKELLLFKPWNKK